MSRAGARIILLILLVLTCIPITMYFVAGNEASVTERASEFDDLTVPDEDPIISEDEAMEVVFDMLPGSDYGDVLDFAQSYDEGGWIYEGTIQGKKAVYSYQVDGENANLLQWIVVGN